MTEEIVTYDTAFDLIASDKAEAKAMLLRARMMVGLVEEIKSWNLTQKNAALKLNIMQPRLNELLKGKFNHFSLDALVELSTRAGLDVTIGLKKAA